VSESWLVLTNAQALKESRYKSVHVHVYNLLILHNIAGTLLLLTMQRRGNPSVPPENRRI
jgi:hypothetical protein